jgi:hypothetical protein
MSSSSQHLFGTIRLNGSITRHEGFVNRKFTRRPSAHLPVRAAPHPQAKDRNNGSLPTAPVVLLVIEDNKMKKDRKMKLATFMVL